MDGTACAAADLDKVSDAEAKARADFDIRWKVALGIEIEDRPLPRVRCRCSGRNTARQGAGGIRGQPAPGSAVGLPEKAWDAGGAGHDLILGRGAVKDTYNLLADGIVKLLRVLISIHSSLGAGTRLRLPSSPTTSLVFP